jgi:hypothetical protein
MNSVFIICPSSVPYTIPEKTTFLAKNFGENFSGNTHPKQKEAKLQLIL